MVPLSTQGKTVLIVEDDPVQVRHLERLVLHRLAGCGLWTLRYEREFAAAASELSNCDAAIVDLHLWWDSHQQRQSEDEVHNPFRAGVRCIETLLLHTSGKIPIALRTIVDGRDIMPELVRFGEHVAYFGKTESEDEKLVRFLNAKLGKDGRESLPD